MCWHKDDTQGPPASSVLPASSVPPGAMESAQSKLLLRVLSGFVATQQQGSRLMFEAHITTREHGDIPGMGQLLETT